MKIKFKRLSPLFVIPKPATKYSAGHDVIATEIKEKAVNKRYCKLGFKAELPEGTKLNLVPRSSITKSTWFMSNSPGIGDADYRGEYEMRFTGIPTGTKLKFSWKWPCITRVLTYDDFPYNIGDRIGQVFLSNNISTKWVEVEELNNTIRGDGGFGHTGK